MEYINYINSFENAQAIENALSAGTLHRPYAALDLSTGKVVFGKVLPPEPTGETRVMATYRIENAGDSVQIFQPCEANFWTKIELDGVDIKADVDEYGYYTFQESGDTTLYFSFTGHDLSQQDEGSGDGWFAELMNLVSLVLSKIFLR